LLLGVFSCFYLAVAAQVGVDYDLVKPKKFENRTLASETSNDGKKFKKSRHFIQNTITHYNFYFNANQKLQLIINLAKSRFRDDYTKLLPFYNYSLDATAAQKKDLDSIIYKTTMGILIHDTRNDWIDNLYLLMGQAYYFRKDFDSAYITLQFINWAFAPRDKDGYYLPIGSNENEMQGNNASVVSTKEHPNVLQKTFSMPPSRNDALVWKVRTYIAQNDYASAASLIQILIHDPQFPSRLGPSLNEVRALWYYQQGIHDSAAFFLEKALPGAENREEVARWEYLIAQLYEKTGHSFEARTFYERTVAHTYNPVLEVYARLNAIRQNKEGGEDYVAKNIEALIKMAHKDRYAAYRDIIYYTAAQMELERKNRPGAISDLRLCIKYSAGSTNNQKNKAFLQLGNLSFDAKDFRSAKSFYDSLIFGPSDLASMGDIGWLGERKSALAVIVANLQVIDRQDSLQRIAALPPSQRDAYIKHLVKVLRRQQGLRDEQDSTFSNSPIRNNNTVPDLFATGNGADWYFDNPTLKAKGFSDFRANWGNRPNVDDWAIASIMKTNLPTPPGARRTIDMTDSAGRVAVAGTIDYKTLLGHLPLTPDKMKKSMDSIEHALFTLGKSYQDGISDYPYAIDAYDTLLYHFPATNHREESLFNLYYCYKQLGDQAHADSVLRLLSSNFPKSNFTARILNPDSVEQAQTSLKNNATREYDKIYIDYIEGRFDDAQAEKKVADSLYGEKYWTPQLLYIESVYFIKTRQDEKARAVLMSINSRYPKTPMADKATSLLEVLGRRRQIEDYLAHLHITRAKDEDTVLNAAPDTAAQAAANRRPRLVRNDSNMLVKEDTSSWARARAREQALANPVGEKPKAGVIGPARLNVDTGSMRKISMDASQLTSLHHLQDSLSKAMLKAQSDSAQMALLRHRADSINNALKKLQADTAQLAAKLRTINSVFTLTPDKPHAVIIVLDKVDPVYVSEAKNAFSRFNLETYYSKGLATENASLNDSLKLVVISGFPNSDDALGYLRTVKPEAPRDIVPWLPAGKYSFLIISNANLQLLLDNKDMTAYRKFVSAAYPTTF
jgi:outer membrane protein assembly factor BamD (BamD/ComL family)